MRTVVAISFGLAFTWILSNRAAAAPGSDRDLRAGFFLLHEVCQEESQVHLITIIKTTPAYLVDYVNRISKKADENLALIDHWPAQDSSLMSEKSPLPPFEVAVRDSIQADKRHDLLFGASGPQFALGLILTQLEATNYIAHMDKVLAEEEPDAGRTRRLSRLSAQWFALRGEGIRFLTAQK